ncbi:unnamed protein product [Vitrella brassicaformis CCMP3155]|uniref:Uncharacterized protein n=1 Tax=Vitrella brassicaformis (strain CCMP3155) TaxID=1169540 RepID=A0A0G4G8C1_VITBC|nr:unnamed protein product [Vitrella brassicaformis CCMP3155]|eukprot:CEM24594.1 unnamed protein product [Vitrella brassicaformis CCMP3155]
MCGRVCLVTGVGTAGIGFEIARWLVKHGATVICAARSRKKLDKAAEKLRKETPGAAVEDGLVMDLSSMQSVEDALCEFHSRNLPLHVLIHNSGRKGPAKRTTTSGGFEVTFAHNHLGPFFLTVGLLDVLISSAPSRIIFVSGEIYRFARVDQDDLCFEKRYESGIVASAFKRATGCGATLFRLLCPLRTAEMGAWTAVWLASSPTVEQTSGKYFIDCRMVEPLPICQNEAFGSKLWAVSEELLRAAGVDYDIFAAAADPALGDPRQTTKRLETIRSRATSVSQKRLSVGETESDEGPAGEDGPRDDKRRHTQEGDGHQATGGHKDAGQGVHLEETPQLPGQPEASAAPEEGASREIVSPPTREERGGAPDTAGAAYVVEGEGHDAEDQGDVT